MKTTRTLGVKREKAQQPPNGERLLPNLIIQADEDHVRNQDGPRFELRLVTMHEGVEGPENRWRWVNPRRFGGHYTHMNAVHLYEEVWKHLHREYDLGHVSAMLVCRETILDSSALRVYPWSEVYPGSIPRSEVCPCGHMGESRNIQQALGSTRRR